MKRFHVLLIVMTLLIGGLLHLSCAYVGPQYPVIYGVPTATPYPNVAVTVTGPPYAMNPLSVTISPGGSVTFVNNTAIADNLLPDNGQGTACGTTAYPLPASGTVVIPFTSIGTYNVHSTIAGHTTCGNSLSCLNCTTGEYTTVSVP
jgi:plastocyanin